MKFGIVLPWGDARIAADFALQSEKAGWDGFFVWEPVWGVDAWVSMTAAAMQTEKIKLGTLLTPLSRMRPWKLASETVTLDNLSGGRLILSVGLGAVDTGFDAFGEETNRKTRAELLDEGLDILTGLWQGQPFHYDGKHYQVKETDFLPPPMPVQQPRIPLWVVGAWPYKKSMKRVLRYDGLLPNVMDEHGQHRDLVPDDVRHMKKYIDGNRTLETPFDIIVEGETPGDDPLQSAAIISSWMDAGATWWIESRWYVPRDDEGLRNVLERIKQGPPRV